MQLGDLVAARVRYGYHRLHVLLRRKGWPVNHKRVYRLYRLEGLALRRRCWRSRASAVRVMPIQAYMANERWSMDSVSDTFTTGHRFRALTLVDNISRVSPAIEVGVSLTRQHVVRRLERLKAIQGLPKQIVVTMAPSSFRRCWTLRHMNDVQLEFSRPGKPTADAFIESFNSWLLQDCLNQHRFRTIEEASAIIEAWRQDYNANHRHSALGYVAPEVFARQWRTAEER